MWVLGDVGIECLLGATRFSLWVLAEIPRMAISPLD